MPPDIHRELDQSLAVQREVPGRESMVRFYLALDYEDDESEDDPESMIQIDHYWGSSTAEVTLRLTLDEDEPLMQLLSPEARVSLDPNVLVRLDVPVAELLTLCAVIKETLPQRDSHAIES